MTLDFMTYRLLRAFTSLLSYCTFHMYLGYCLLFPHAPLFLEPDMFSTICEVELISG